MYPVGVRRQAVALLDEGRSLRSVSISTGISRPVLRTWRDAGVEPRRFVASCCRCNAPPEAPGDAVAYAYLLGLYLGDGCLSAQKKEGVYALRIACADCWPGLSDECAEAISCVLPNRVHRNPGFGCHYVTAYSRHWPHLFPQHGAGPKHQRRIVLQPWHRQIIDEHPGRLLRGLFHSDGWRGTNPVHQKVAGHERTYRYPRYLFSNRSADIMRICEGALDHLEIAWRLNSACSLSVARRDAVAALDLHVGPKY
jgi:hypothetical protein